MADETGTLSAGDNMADITDEALVAWLKEEGFDHVVRHDAGDDMPATDDYWIREALGSCDPSHLVNQDTPTPGRWRVASGSAGDGEWIDLGIDLTPDEAQALLARPAADA